MPRPAHRPPELAIPVVSLAALRNALAAEVGPDAAARALSAAGHAAGDALFRQLAGNADENGVASVADVSEATFWRRMTQLFITRGWGTLTHAHAHDGVGALDASDWVEAEEGARASRPSCFFTTGMLANLLGSAAASPISVLEVECRSRGDARCRFLFGSHDALNAIYERIDAGESSESALGGLV